MSVVKTSDKKSTDLDDVLKKFKICSRYYIECMVLIFLAYMSNSMYSSNFVFVAEEVGYRCKDERFENNSCAALRNSSEVCTEWVYDNPYSFVAEFQLACQEWKRTLVGTVHSFGYMIGLLLVGPLSDRLGRKMVIVMTGVLGGVLGVARSFTSYYWVYILLEFLEAAVGDSCSPMFMLTIEMVPSDKRLLFQMLCSYGYTLGSLTLPLMAWLVPYWRNLLRVIFTPAVFFLFYIFLLDESPRWLLSKGKKDEAIAILEKAAKKNKVKLDRNALDNLSYEENKGVNFIQLLKDTFTSPALLKRFFICLSWWTTSTFVNYGMTINSVSLQGNKYINFALITVVDIPGNLIITYLLIRFKRKVPLIFSFVFAAILCLSQPFVPSNLPWLSILLFMIGKLMSSSYFAITYIFTSELFPTYTRNSMHALCSSLGRVGSIIAPQTPLLMAYWHGLPSLVFGLASLLAGMATLFAPDTADDALPDNVTQAEALGKHNSCKKEISSPTLSKRKEHVITNEKNNSRL
ncbi:solute carrier family 22 member 3-like [Pectinophora gossypiella]|uniref:solute carrier family 22 member 3-like n=1 Tax=Pectinophora gossypiella TaxID=13191 RepID=UPI00214E4BD1|nr:solute carrier family 22 member 3-like [Pectinophora gossypiella]